MAHVAIDSSGSRAVIAVDGVPIKCVAGIDVRMRPNSLLQVTLCLTPDPSMILIEGAELMIGDLACPPALEDAIYQHLQVKRSIASR